MYLKCDVHVVLILGGKWVRFSINNCQTYKRHASSRSGNFIGSFVVKFTCLHQSEFYVSTLSSGQWRSQPLHSVENLCLIWNFLLNYIYWNLVLWLKLSERCIYGSCNFCKHFLLDDINRQEIFWKVVHNYWCICIHTKMTVSQLYMWSRGAKFSGSCVRGSLFINPAGLHRTSFTSLHAIVTR